MARSQNDNNFLQPIFSLLGLVVSGFSAIAPLFAQSQLARFFVNEQLSLPASLVSIILGILFSWYLINIHGFINIPIGIKKNRGNGYNQPWKEVNERNAVPIIIVVAITLLVTFFVLQQQTGDVWAVAQMAVYVIFFTLVIGTFSMLVAQTKNRFEWEQQIANTGSIVYETLERNGAVKSGIRIVQNTQVTNPDELIEYGIDPSEQLLARRLVIETVKQDRQRMIVYISSDYQRLITTVPVDEKESNDAN
jgi:hypothetical protein